MSEATEVTESANSKIIEVLEALTAQTEVVIQDYLGNEYHLNTRLPARKQIQAMREFKALFEMPIMQDALPRMNALQGNEFATVVTAFNLIASDEVLDVVDRVFALVYPKALDKAHYAASVEDSLTSKKATDLFEIEEILAALVPFFARPILKTMRLAV